MPWPLDNRPPALLVSDAKDPEERPVAELDKMPDMSVINTWLQEGWKAKKCSDDEQIIVFWVSEETMREEHNKYHHTGTDAMLVFPFDMREELGNHAYSEGFEPDLLGDIFLCPSLLLQEASDHQMELQEYVCRIVIHAYLHLLGYTHESSDPRLVRLMHRPERKIIEGMGLIYPLPVQPNMPERFRRALIPIYGVNPLKEG